MFAGGTAADEFIFLGSLGEECVCLSVTVRHSFLDCFSKVKPAFVTFLSLLRERCLSSFFWMKKIIFLHN